MSRPLETSRSPHFRTLRFASLDQCVAEVERIRAAALNGDLCANGNWTPGQVLSHIAAWIDYGYEGYPIGKPPWFVRWWLRRSLPKILAGQMPRGVRIPRVAGGTTGMDDVPTSPAADRLVASLRRLGSDEPAPFDSPAFGAMSHEDRIRLNLRHAELHLGFLSY
jgi:hypothetical protein